MARSYIAVLGDVVASRRLAPRGRDRLQRELQAALAVVNRRWRRWVAARFAVTLGTSSRASSPAERWCGRSCTGSGRS